jgi:hypothetical protein
LKKKIEDILIENGVEDIKVTDLTDNTKNAKIIPFKNKEIEK